MSESTTTLFQNEEDCGMYSSVSECPPVLSFETLMTILAALVIFALALGCVFIYCIQAKLTRGRILASTRPRPGLSNSSIWTTNSDNASPRTRTIHGEFNQLSLPYYRFENPPPSYFSIQTELRKTNTDTSLHINDPPPAYESDFHEDGNTNLEIPSIADNNEDTSTRLEILQTEFNSRAT